MWEKFSIISSLCHVRAFSSNRLIESSALSFLVYFAMEGFLGCKSDFPQERQDRDPNFYTQTSLGTCTENQSRATYSDTTDPDYFRHEMRAEI
jgi:hypothetical protein